MSLHICMVPGQPMTRHVDDHMDPPHVFEYSPRRKFYCHSCGRRRWAKNLSIQVHYDCVRIYCTDKWYARSPEFPFAYERLCKGVGKPR